MEKVHKYNTRVRQRMSDEYVSALKKREELIAKRNKVFVEMGADNISHAEYLRLEKLSNQIKLGLVKINTEIDIWDKAREICLDVADEIFK